SPARHEPSPDRPPPTGSARERGAVVPLYRRFPRARTACPGRHAGYAYTRRLMDLARNLKIDSVSRLHPTRPLCVRPEQTIAEAVAVMRREAVGCLLVCTGQEGRQVVVGIFTERDLLRRVLAAGKPLTTPVAECMTPDPVTINPKESVASAIRRMEEG